MTVTELIAELQKMPGDLSVFVTTDDACCYGEPDRVTLVDYRDRYPNAQPHVRIE